MTAPRLQRGHTVAFRTSHQRWNPAACTLWPNLALVLWSLLGSVLLALLAGACSSDAPRAPSASTEPRVLVVVAEPAEAHPGEQVSLTAVVAAPLETESASVDAWSYCTKPRTPGASGSASAACLTDSVQPEPGMTAPATPSTATVATATPVVMPPPALAPLAGSVQSVTAMLPTDACRNFGPDPPTDDFRPQDPDVTGGYYQPVRLDAFGRIWFHFQRLRCPLGNAPTDIAKEFLENYIANQNPHPTSLTAASETTTESSTSPTPLVADLDSSLVDLTWHVPQAAQTLSIRLTWTLDPRETYLRFDPDAHGLVEQREDVTITWITNSGTLTPQPPTFTKEGASAAALLTLDTTRSSAWAIVRDSRGGSAAVRLDVER